MQQHQLRVSLNEAQRYGHPVLVELETMAPLLPLFLQVLQHREKRRHHLHDDRRRNVRIDAERGDADPTQRAPAEEVEEAE